jgi:putative ABC transport system permease protein
MARFVSLGRIMRELWHDVRHGARVLIHHRGTFVLAALCLGLGVGINTTMFASADPWLFRSLPYTEPERLATVREVRGSDAASELSTPSFLEWSRASRAFSAWGAFVRVGYNLSTAEEPERVQGATITASLFPMLGARPVVGRPFQAEEDDTGAGRVCLISHALAQRRFTQVELAVGRTLTIDGQDHTIVGVMPRGWAFPEYAEIWKPLSLAATEPGDAASDRTRRRLDVIARLRPEASFEAAEAELDAAARRAAREHPESNAGWGARVRPLAEDMTPPGVRVALVLMLVATGFVLLIACANVATLLLAQALDRRREIATRIALGAGPGRLIRQLLAESLLLSFAGGVLGIGLAVYGMDFMASLTPVRLPFWATTGINLRVLAATLASCVVASIAFGLLPALEAARIDVRSSLQEGGRGSSVGARTRRLGERLVATELALALVLASGAGIMLRSFWERQRAPLGFELRNALVARVSLSGERYRNPAARAAFVDAALRRVSSVPGVEAVAATTALPMSDELGSGWAAVAFEVEGTPLPPVERPTALYASATAHLLRALGLPLVKGRTFRESEIADAAPVALVNEDLARRFWPQADAVGRRLRLADGAWLSIIGVVGDTREPSSILGFGAKPSGQIYLPYTRDAGDTLALVVRGPQRPGLAQAVMAAVGGADRALPVYGVRTLEEARRLADWVAAMWGQLLAWAAGGGVLLTCTGIYGVVSRGVARRSHEIGVRMALGADRRAVVGLVLRQGMRLGLIGIAAGVVGSLLLMRALSGLIYGVSPYDPPTLACAALALAGLTLLATYGPALRATRVDPMRALRSE